MLTHRQQTMDVRTLLEKGSISCLAQILARSKSVATQKAPVKHSTAFHGSVDGASVMVPYAMTDSLDNIRGAEEDKNCEQASG